MFTASIQKKCLVLRRQFPSSFTRKKIYSPQDNTTLVNRGPTAYTLSLTNGGETRGRLYLMFFGGFFRFQEHRKNGWGNRWLLEMPTMTFHTPSAKHASGISSGTQSIATNYFSVFVRAGVYGNFKAVPEVLIAGSAKGTVTFFRQHNLVCRIAGRGPIGPGENGAHSIHLTKTLSPIQPT